MLHPSCCNRIGLGRDFSVTTEYFFVAIEFVKAKSFYFSTKCFCVATEFAKANSFYVATKCFCVTTDFGQDQGISCHDREFLCRDRVSWSGVATKYFMLRQSILCYDKVFYVGQEQEFSCRDKVFLCRD